MNLYDRFQEEVDSQAEWLTELCRHLVRIPRENPRGGRKESVTPDLVRTTVDILILRGMTREAVTQEIEACGVTNE